jgi:acyl carrier protein
LFIEVGPNAHLSSNIKASLVDINSKTTILTLDRPGKNNRNIISRTKGNIWCYTSQVFDELWASHSNARKIPLPTYPFERKRHWIDYIPKDAETRVPSKIETDLGPITNYNTDDNSIISSIIEIWKEYIGAPDIKPADNFFDLGGTSLLAISISDEIEMKYSISFGLRDFYDTPSVIGISECISNKLQNELK